MELTRHDMELAEEVAHEACNDRTLDGADDPFEAVIWRRWGATKGGVGFAHSRTRARVRAAVREFYAPRDWSPEPSGEGAQCG
jgi:hypothetical protein